MAKCLPPPRVSTVELQVRRTSSAHTRAATIKTRLLSLFARAFAHGHGHAKRVSSVAVGPSVPAVATTQNITTIPATRPPASAPTNIVVSTPRAPSPTTSSGPGSVGTMASSTSPQPPGAPAKRTPKDFIFGKVIGEGSFSTVYLAKDIHSHKEYAIKVCDKRHIIREKKAEYVKREKEVLNILSSNAKASASFFVKLYCTFQDADRLYFVLSYAKNGELLPYITKVGSFDLECTRFYSAEILQALEHLHALGIIHRDLKPENILLNEKMHILITDFGSAKILNPPNPTNNEDDHAPLRRKNSFVGTAQYVSPELLTDKRACPSSDLWALGCIIYQMISGLTPFHAGSEYLIFQKILRLEFECPDGFSPQAKDLVEKLLVLESDRRLGATDTNGYPSIKKHPFYKTIDFENLYNQTPPSIYPYLPGTSDHEEMRSQYMVPDHLEPGLDDRQLTRLLGLDLQDSSSSGSVNSVIPVPEKTKSKNAAITDLSQEEATQRLEKQMRENSKWHNLVEGNLILKQGLVDKRKGLFARRRMLLLTLGPHMYYVDPTNMVLKGEIPWSPELRVESKTFKIFFVHTPNRTYYLEDPEGYALEWCKAIEDVRRHTYGLDS